jgi:hypothetical protein
MGVVFTVDTTGHETVLYGLTGGADGGLPNAGVIRDSAGNLYGTTWHGGTGGAGVVSAQYSSSKAQQRRSDGHARWLRLTFAFLRTLL